MKLSILSSLSLFTFVAFFSMIHHLIIEIAPTAPGQSLADPLTHAAPAHLPSGLQRALG